jgi:hypothetical protein
VTTNPKEVEDSPTGGCGNWQPSVSYPFCRPAEGWTGNVRVILKLSDSAFISAMPIIDRAASGLPAAEKKACRGKSREMEME